MKTAQERSLSRYPTISCRFKLFQALQRFKLSWFQTMLISETAADFRVSWFQTTKTYFLSLIDENCARALTLALSKNLSQVPIVSPISTFRVVLISDDPDLRDCFWFQSVLISDSKNLFQILTKLLPNQHFMTCAHWSNHSSQRKQTSQTHLKLLASASLLLQFAV